MAISIVDYINSNGGDSSYAARKKLAEQQGITGYRGTADQNMTLLKNLQNATFKASGVTPSASTNIGVSQNVLAGTGLANANSGTAAAAGPGVVTSSESSSSSSTKRGYTPSQNVADAYNRMTSYAADMPGDYSESDNVSDYRDKLKGVESAKPADFTSQYSAQISNLLNQVYGDNKFSFTAKDMQDSDLYKMYAQQYQASADRAMRDTMGNAAALSGGYGSSYAQNVGQQQYDQTMSGLNDKAMDIYQQKYNEYLNDRSNRYNQLNAFNTQDQVDYSRYRDKVGDWQTDRSYYQDALNNERNYDLNAYQANNANYWNGANYLSGRYDSEKNTDFGAYQQDQSDAQWQKTYDMQKQQADLDNQLKQLQIQQAETALADSASGGSGGSGGSSGRSGRRRSSGRKSSKSSKTGSTSGSTIVKPTVKSSDVIDQYMQLKNQDGGVLGSENNGTAQDYVNFVKSNYDIDFTPSVSNLDKWAKKK